MKKSRATILKIASGLLISALCLFLAIRGIHIQAFLQVFRTVKVSYVILFLLVLLVTLLLRALIYYRFLGSLKKVSLFSIYEGLLIGYFITAIFPLRAGDLIKAYVIGKLNGVSKTYTFTLALIERFFDMITLYLSFLLLLCIAEVPKNYRIAAIIMGCGLTLLIILIILTIRSEQMPSRLVNTMCFFLSESLKAKLREKLMTMREAMKILCNWRDVLFIQGIFVLIYGGYYGISYLTGLAIGLHLTLPMILLLLVTIAIGASIAASPGGLGVHQYACVLVFSFYHISREQALTFSLIQNTLTVVLTLFLGWLFLLHTNLSLTGALPRSEETGEQKAGECER